ncbi:hypothetical protein [Aporhodopirellula aestuarii]|uniref:Uncharacterized protein n=1 Tax=Aporhodopirellula aestuarii TaxID=2950107 RepID=A0ABT0TYJ3_9BACT|nr:hypothetical protein [Aporhodopirellula aestuarii]MCM2369635.1 hypothetical protein [Aporhodopirellula aestuarii]
MIIDRNETQPRLVIQILSSTGSRDPITGITYDDVDLAVSELRPSASSWSTVTLVSGTVGTYLANSFAEIGDGLYQVCLPSASVSAGDTTHIRVVYAANDPQYGTMTATGGTDVSALLTTSEFEAALPDNFADLSIESETGKVSAAPSSVVSVDAPSADEAGRIILTQRDDYENDSDIEPIGPIRISTSQQLLRETDPPSLRFGATLTFGEGYGNTHFIGTAYAEAVSGEPNQYDLYIEIEHDELDKTPGRYGWDIEAVYADDDVSTLVRGTLDLRQSMGDHEERD